MASVLLYYAIVLVVIAIHILYHIYYLFHNISLICEERPVLDY